MNKVIITSEIEQYITENLSLKRRTHCENVAIEAVKLAQAFGGDADKAYFCGMVHDIAKELPPDQQQLLVFNSKMDVSETEKASKPLWHAISGAQLLMERFGVTDTDVLSAVRYHTVSRAGMSRLEEIIYLADLISADRTYSDVKRMRKICYEGINKGMLEALRFLICDCVKKSNSIPISSINAYDYYLSINRRKNEQDKTKE